MNRGSRHLRYRKSVYRRRRAKAVLIVSAIVLGILLVAFLLIGSMFSDKLEDSETPTDTTAQSNATLPSYPFERVPHVKAPLLSLEGAPTTIYRQMDTLVAAGNTALTVPMTDDNGMLLYHSSQAISGGYAIAGTSSLSLSELSELAHANGVRLCGAYVLKAAAEENNLTRSVLLAESAAVISEAFLAGIDDIVIIVPTLPTERQAELVRFAESIRSFAQNAVIGLSLPEAEINSPDAKRIDALAKSFDYLALDLRHEDAEDPVLFAEERMSTMLYYLLRYEMRVMIPALSDEEMQAKLITAVESESIDNRMTVLP